MSTIAQWPFWQLDPAAQWYVRGPSHPHCVGRERRTVAGRLFFVLHVGLTGPGPNNLPQGKQERVPLLDALLCPDEQRPKRLNSSPSTTSRGTAQLLVRCASLNAKRKWLSYTMGRVIRFLLLLCAEALLLAMGLVPRWPPTYNMSQSTFLMPCNYSGFFDPEIGAR